MNSIQDILTHYLSSLVNEKKKNFLQAWIDTIGPDCAIHSRIKDIKGTKLIVEVDNPAWASHMHSQQRHYLTQINNKQRKIPIDSIAFILSEIDFK